MRRRFALSILIAVVSASALIGWAVLGETTTTPFRATLVQTGEGTWTGTGISGSWISLMLNLTSPSSVPAPKLEFTITPPMGSQIVLPNGSRVGHVEVEYVPGLDPAFLAALPGGGVWTGFAVKITNSDGSTVANPLPSGQTGVVTTVVESHATLNMTFPAGTLPPGYSIQALEFGSPGIAGVTLG